MRKLLKKVIVKSAPGLVHSVRRVPRIESRVAALQEQVNDMRAMLGRIEHFDNRVEMLKRLASEVEPYQPAYGLSGVVEAPLRGESRERAVVIEAALQPVAGKRILDIGSSLGYFAYYFADRGAAVEGWESHPKNAEVARKIGELNGIPVDFRIKEFNEDTVKTIPAGKFDAVFVLSVFHHIIRYEGLEATQKLVKELMDRSPVMVVELAKKGEDPKLPWDKFQPDNELAIFDLVKDEVEIKKIGDFTNHLSKKTRPLYVIRKKQVVKVAAHVYNYDEVTAAAYKGSPVVYAGVQRRYYFGKDFIVKEYSFDAKSQAENMQILNEIKNLTDVNRRQVSVFHAPKLIDFAIDFPHSAKVVIERTEGVLATDADLKGSPAKVVHMVKDILHTLSDLEKLRLHHNDIRTWNVIIDSKGSAWLIDYGLVSPQTDDDDMISLLWLTYAVLLGERESYKLNKQELPPRATLAVVPELGKVYDAVQKGERSAAKLLALLG